MYLVRIGNTTYNLEHLVTAYTTTLADKTTVLNLQFAVADGMAEGFTAYSLQLKGYAASRMAAFLKLRSLDLTIPDESTPN